MGHHHAEVPPADNGVDVLREVAIAGQGAAKVLEIHVRSEIAKGSLEVVLQDWSRRP